MGRSYHARRQQQSNTWKLVAIGALITAIVGVIFTYPAMPWYNTSLTVDLEYKGNPVSGTVNVIATSGQAQGMQYVRNGSVVNLYLPHGVYYVSATYTNTTGYHFQTGVWNIYLNGLTFHMTIELSNNTAWY